MQADCFNLKHCACRIQVRTEYYNEHVLLILYRTLAYKWSRALLLSEFYLHRFRLQVLLPMDTQSSSRRAFKLAQERDLKSLKIGDGPETRETDLDVLLLRDFETKERESKGREVALVLKLLVKDKLLHSGKDP